MLALRAGARRVYGVEVDPRTLEVSTALMRAHGFGPDRFVPIVGRSDAIDLPEPVDVLVGELVDSIGIGENGPRFLSEARARWLAPGGNVVPGRMIVDVGLADSAEFAAERRFFAETLRTRHELDYRPILPHLAQARRSLRVELHEVRSDLVVWQEIDLDAGELTTPTTVVETECTASGHVNGLVFAHRLELADGVWIDTRPGTRLTSWEQGFLPLPQPIRVSRGERFRIELTCPPTAEAWTPLEVVLDRVAAVPVGDGPK